MIELSLSDWLRTTLPDVATVGSRRASALQSLRTSLDGRIWVGRMPTRTDALTLTLTRIATDRTNYLDAEDSCVQTLIQADLWCKHSAGAEITLKAADALRVAIHGYQGYWSGRWVWDVVQERETSLVSAPNDGDLAWEYRVSTDYNVTWSDRTTI